MTQKRILGIGSALVDILTQIEDESILTRLNLPKGSMQYVDAETSVKIGKDLSAYQSKMAAGGSAANTVSGLARLGVDAGFLSKVGKDDVGRFFEQEMDKSKVKPLLLKSETPSGRVQALVTKDGERTFATCLGASAELSKENINPELFDGWDLFYIEGYLVANPTMLEKAIRTAKEKGLKTAIDLASYNVVEENREFLLRLVEDQIDIVFANEKEAKALTGLEPEEALLFLASKCDIAVVKVGAKGSLIQCKDEIVRIGKVGDIVVDTTGAGDLWAAGFLAGWSKCESLKKCGMMGSILAANIIQVVGAKMDDERWNGIYKAIAAIH